MKRRDALKTAAALSCAPALATGSSGVKAPPSRVSADVIATLHLQAQRWTAGDLDGFCAVYADDALFLSPSGLTRGRAAVLARYRKKYLDGPEGKAGMGALSFAIEDARSVGPLATVALRWTLTWPDAMQKPPATGLSLVTLENVDGSGDTAHWLIRHDASM
jgi:hypothetical protein